MLIPHYFTSSSYSFPFTLSHSLTLARILLFLLPSHRILTHTPPCLALTFSFSFSLSYSLLTTHTHSYSFLTTSTLTLPLPLPSHHLPSLSSLLSYSFLTTPTPFSPLPLHSHHSQICPTMRYMPSGGAGVSLPVLHFFEDIGIPICEGYGLTETCE